VIGSLLAFGKGLTATLTLAVTLTPNALTLLERCANAVGHQTMAGLIEHESGWYPYAIGDNTAKKSYFPKTYNDAVRLAIILRQQGHDIDAGLAQINDTNWANYHLDEFTVFNDCKNVSTGSTILARAYQGALYHFPAGDEALRHALSAYNSGKYYASLRYAKGVIDNALSVRFQYVVQQPPAPAVPARPQPLAETLAASGVVHRLFVRRAAAPTPPTLPGTETVLGWALPPHTSLPVKKR
jgi:type IV secretion system protein VirB1